MRKIHFNEETITKIKQYINDGHTLNQVCNRFNIKYDTLKRVMFEYNIKPFYFEKSNNPIKITEETENLVCNLFKHTNTTLQDIRIQTKLEHYIVTHILENNFTQQEIDERKAKLYRQSKVGNKNKMFGKTKESHPNYKGVVEDGKGYLMVLKPEWYTGRVGCKHVYQHHVVICEQLNLTEIPKGYCVHHIDGNKKNNDISNLSLMTLSGHTKLHQIQNELCKVQRLSKME